MFVARVTASKEQFGFAAGSVCHERAWVTQTSPRVVADLLNQIPTVVDQVGDAALVVAPKIITGKLSYVVVGKQHSGTVPVGVVVEGGRAAVLGHRLPRIEI